MRLYIFCYVFDSAVGCGISSQDSAAGSDGRKAGGTGGVHSQGIALDGVGKGVCILLVT